MGEKKKNQATCLRKQQISVGIGSNTHYCYLILEGFISVL